MITGRCQTMSNIIKVESSFYVNVSDKLNASLLSGASDESRFITANCFRNNNRQLINSKIDYYLNTHIGVYDDFFIVADNLLKIEELKGRTVNNFRGGN